MSGPKYIATVSSHRILGNIILPYEVVQQQGKGFFTVKERLTKSDIPQLNGQLPDGIESLVMISEQYDENELVRVFSKKKKISSTTFLNSLDHDFLENHIRPYIETRVAKALETVKANNIQLFYKDQVSNIHNEDNIEVVNMPAEAIFHFIKEDDGIKYFLSIKSGENNIDLHGKSGLILVNNPCRLVLENKLYMFEDIDGKKLLPFFTKKYVQIPQTSEKKYFESFVKNAIRDYSVDAVGFEVEEIKKAPKALLSIENDLEGNPSLLLKFLYDYKSVFMANKPTTPKVLFRNENGRYSFVKIMRDYLYEGNVVNYLTGLGLVGKSGPWYYLHAEDAGFYPTMQWVMAHAALLAGKGITIDQSFFQDKYSLDEIKLDMKIHQEKDWFDLFATVRIGSFQIPFIKLKRNILKNIREFELPNGKIAILPEEWFERFRDMFLFSEKDGDKMRFKSFHAAVLEDRIELPDAKLHDKFKKISFDDNKLDIVAPEGLRAELRPYQALGYRFMLQSGESNLGVCLADDMGLGKTLQTLSVLLHRISNKENIVEKVVGLNGVKQLSLFGDSEVSKIKERQASLIVMPSSLIHNWFNEINKFTPQLTTYIYTGVNRIKDISQFGQYDVLLTTYGTLRVDYELLGQYQFFYAILDESQVIKNIQSKTYKAVNELNAKHKLVLTGTPIENSLSDLWAQLNFLNKGLLGNYNFFKEEFLTPIEKQNDEQKQLKLQKIIQPFILRRTKKEVAKDLPDLTEQVIFCDLTEEQEKYYEKEKSKIRNTILQNIEKNGMEKSTFIVLQGLTKLRQLANHPYLIDSSYKHSSGKFEEVTRNIDSLVGENHKALIFSSFVKNLEMFENYCLENQIGYSKLTGSTRDREGVVKAFQENQENKLFLISLKAGGVGLNLTAAEYVFMLDPWWNPAAESQAINRAHRIGQVNKVFVYRFISSGTIEEKIQLLQQKKSRLAEVFVNSNNPFKEMSFENIMELFD
jgi:SNF2 family DNA or RNA helicase